MNEKYVLITGAMGEDECGIFLTVSAKSAEIALRLGVAKFIETNAEDLGDFSVEFDYSAFQPFPFARMIPKEPTEMKKMFIEVYPENYEC